MATYAQQINFLDVATLSFAFFLVRGILMRVIAFVNCYFNQSAVVGGVVVIC
jgi:hypothetical protein